LTNNKDDLNEVNNNLKEETVKILLEDGTTKRAKNLKLSPASTSWTDLETERVNNIETEKIGEIRVLNRTRSGRTGLIIGALTGGIFAATEAGSEGYEWLDSVEEGFVKVLGGEGGSKTTRYVSGFILGAVAGGLLGYTVGAIIGSTDKYVIHHETENYEDLDSSTVKIEFTKVVEKGSGYLIILKGGKEILLKRSDYIYRRTTRTGQQFIIVTKHVYESKFK
jgi:hypothetical protein